jgi:FkbM family methyltransferase
MSFWREPYHIDRVAYTEVVTNNCYRLTQFKPEDIIIDVGGHIGAFCYAALDRGARRIITVEADARNHAQLLKNIAARDLQGASVEPLNAAVWRSDVPQTHLSMARFNVHDGNANTGAGTLAISAEDPDGYRVMTVAFDDLIGMAGDQRIAFVKMDCEGAEFPILYTSKKLHLIDTIAMELHPDYDFRPEARVEGFENSLNGVVEFLTKSGFEVTVDAAIPHRPYVWAKRA